VLPPSVNQSGWKFTVTADHEIRFGLGAIRNVGWGAIESILAGRAAGGPYTSLADFCERLDLRLCNKRVIESLIAAGALDQVNDNRAQLVAALDATLASAQLRQAERQAGQATLFDEGDDAGVPPPALPEVEPWSEAERLAREKDVIGFFISGHPLERFRDEVALFGTRTTATLETWSEHQVTAAVVVTAVSRRISRKSGAEYARLTLEDFHGVAEAIVFPEAWSKLSRVIVPDAALLLTGGYSARDRGEDRAPFVVEAAQPLEDLKRSGAVGLALTWRAGEGPGRDVSRAAAALCAAHPGPAPILVEWSDGNGHAARLRSQRLRVELSDVLLDALRHLLGAEHVRLVRAR
jgi:DNA polymerase-3 subunit alpha